MSKPIGKEMVSFIQSKAGLNTLGAIGFCIVVASLVKIIDEWHLRSENKKLSDLILKSNEYIGQLMNDCDKILDSTLSISKIKISGEGLEKEIFSYPYDEPQEENIKSEKLLLGASLEEKDKDHEKPKNQLYPDLKECLDEIATLSDLMSQKNADSQSLAALVNTLYSPVKPSLNTTGTPGSTGSGLKKCTELSGKDRMECINLFKDKICELAIEDLKTYINGENHSDQAKNALLEDIFDATYCDDGQGRCYFYDNQAIPAIKNFVSSNIQCYLNKKLFRKEKEDIFYNDSLAVKKFLHLRSENSDPQVVLKKIKGDKFNQVEWQKKQSSQKITLKTQCIGKIKSNNVSFFSINEEGI